MLALFQAHKISFIYTVVWVLILALFQSQLFFPCTLEELNDNEQFVQQRFVKTSKLSGLLAFLSGYRV